MALCMKCGTIMHDDDINKHICNPLALPTKGKVREVKTTEVVINETA